ncbi:MAG: tape measure protein [Eggerthella lenta]
MASAVQQLAPSSASLTQAKDRALAFNDALLAGGTSAGTQQNAMQQLTKAVSTNKMEMDSWMSIQEAMPGQLDQVAKSMLGQGASASDLYDAMKSGRVSVSDFADAIVALDQQGGDGFDSFYQQAQNATGGIGTSMSNMKNAVTKGIANVIQAFGSDNIAAGFDFFKAGVNGVFGAAADAASNIGPAITTLSGGFQKFSDDLAGFAAEAGEAPTWGDALCLLVQDVGQAFGLSYEELQPWATASPKPATPRRAPSRSREGGGGLRVGDLGGQGSARGRRPRSIRSPEPVRTAVAALAVVAGRGRRQTRRRRRKGGGNIQVARLVVLLDRGQGGAGREAASRRSDRARARPAPGRGFRRRRSSRSAAPWRSSASASSPRPPGCRCSRTWPSGSRMRYARHRRHGGLVAAVALLAAGAALLGAGAHGRSRRVRGVRRRRGARRRRRPGGVRRAGVGGDAAAADRRVRRPGGARDRTARGVRAAALPAMLVAGAGLLACGAGALVAGAGVPPAERCARGGCRLAGCRCRCAHARRGAADGCGRVYGCCCRRAHARHGRAIAGAGLWSAAPALFSPVLACWFSVQVRLWRVLASWCLQRGLLLAGGATLLAGGVALLAGGMTALAAAVMAAASGCKAMATAMPTIASAAPGAAASCRARRRIHSGGGRRRCGIARLARACCCCRICGGWGRRIQSGAAGACGRCSSCCRWVQDHNLGT